MTISITDWIKDDLIPSLFPHIPQLFPEHNFNKFTWGWGSKTYLDGTPHKDRKNKTAILKQLLLSFLNRAVKGSAWLIT
jgi:hypothetical protein